MASGGVYQVTNRDIIEAAGQRNVSALNYHFGNRDDLVLAVLGVTGPGLDAGRGDLGASLDVESTTHEIVHALVVPYGGCLQSESGRHYVRIVDQLRGQFGSDSSTTAGNSAAGSDVHLNRLLGLLDRRPVAATPGVRRERLVAMVTLMTAMVAERARLIERGGTPRMDHQDFIENLESMLVGVIEAPIPTAVSARASTTRI